MGKIKLLWLPCLLVIFSGIIFAQKVTVNSLGSNKKFCIGDSLNITWETPGLSDTHVEIYLKNSRGTENVEVIAEHTDNDGKYTWPIPKHINSGFYRIGVKTVDSLKSANGSTFQIINCVSLPKLKLKPKVLRPVKPVKPVLEVRPILTFSQVDHGDVLASPARLIISYGNKTCNLYNGSRKTINVSEQDPLVDGAGKVSVTVKYTLRNTTSKNFKFNVYLVYDNQVIFGELITLLAGKSKIITKSTKLKSTTTYKTVILRGPIGISDDTHIIFLNARLWLRIFAV